MTREEESINKMNVAILSDLRDPREPVEILKELEKLPDAIRDSVERFGTAKEKHKHEWSKMYLSLKASNPKFSITQLEAMVDADDDIYKLALDKVLAEAQLEKNTHQFDADRSAISFHGRSHEVIG